MIDHAEDYWYDEGKTDAMGGKEMRVDLVNLLDERYYAAYVEGFEKGQEARDG